MDCVDGFDSQYAPFEETDSFTFSGCPMTEQAFFGILPAVRRFKILTVTGEKKLISIFIPCTVLFMPCEVRW